MSPGGGGVGPYKKFVKIFFENNFTFWVWIEFSFEYHFCLGLHLLKGNNRRWGIINAMYHWGRSTWDWGRVIWILVHNWNNWRYFRRITVVTFDYWWWCQFRLYPCQCYFWRSVNLLNWLICLLTPWGRFIPSWFRFFPSRATRRWDGQYDWRCTRWTAEWGRSDLTTGWSSFGCGCWGCWCSRWGSVD